MEGLSHQRFEKTGGFEGAAAPGEIRVPVSADTEWQRSGLSKLRRSLPTKWPYYLYGAISVGMAIVLIALDKCEVGK